MKRLLSHVLAFVFGGLLASYGAEVKRHEEELKRERERREANRSEPPVPEPLPDVDQIREAFDRVGRRSGPERPRGQW